MVADPARRQVERWCVAGRVQGVGFRWFVREIARRHGVTGDVRNLADGRVEVRAAGQPAQLASVLEQVRRGPRGARVDGVEVTRIDPAPEFDEFAIRG
jgi:acylphosphatase